MLKNLLAKTKGQSMQGILGFIIMGVIAVLLISEFITAGNFSGTVSTIMDLLPIAVAGLLAYFVVSAYGTR